MGVGMNAWFRATVQQYGVYTIQTGTRHQANKVLHQGAPLIAACQSKHFWAKITGL